MESTLKKLQAEFPKLQFTADKRFCWSPETKEIFYDGSKKSKKAAWSLLHETGHALLHHQTYAADFELLRLEIAAWEKAKEIAPKLGIEIDEEHIQDCLDTYRDWLYQRSICPTCHTKALQESDYRHYRCFNCHTIWRVTPSRFARPYRKTKNIPQPLAPVFQLNQ